MSQHFHSRQPESNCSKTERTHDVIRSLGSLGIESLIQISIESIHMHHAIYHDISYTFVAQRVEGKWPVSARQCVPVPSQAESKD